MKAGWTISAALHAIVIAWGLIAFVSRPLSAPPTEFLATDIISAADFSQLTRGERTAKPAETPKPLVEKVGEDKPVENPTVKVTDKPEIAPTADQQPKPEPEKKAEPKPPAPQPQAKPETKQAFAKEPEPKVDPIAEALKKDNKPDKKPEKKAETPKPPQKKPEPAKPQPEYNSSRIAALLDKRDPRRQAATGSTLSDTPALGTPTGRAAELSLNELDMLKARLARCWQVPEGLRDARDLVVTIHFLLRQDGSLQAEPRVTNRPNHPSFQVAAETALRAIRTCAPYTFLPVAKYEAWKDLIIDFDPREMFRG